MLYWNFLAALATGIALATYMLVTFGATPYVGLRAPVGPALYVAFQVCMWFIAYRHREGHGAAAASGVILMSPLVTSLIAPDMRGRDLDVGLTAFLAWLALSHFAYAVSGWRLRPRSPLDL